MKLKVKIAKDAAEIPFSSKALKAAAVSSVMKISKYNKEAAKLLLKYPKTTGALIGLAIAAGIGKLAYKVSSNKNKAEDLSVPATSGNYLAELGNGVVSTIRRYSITPEAGILKNLKNLILKNPKTTALIAGTAMVSAGMAMRKKKDK